MARDPGLEELMREELGDRTGLSEKSMFGGWAFMLNGNRSAVHAMTACCCAWARAMMAGRWRSPA